MRGVTLSHAAQLQPGLLKRSSTVYQDAYPVRPQGIHYVYPPPSFESIFTFIKSFMKEKLKKRVSDLQGGWPVPRNFLAVIYTATYERKKRASLKPSQPLPVLLYVLRRPGGDSLRAVPACRASLS